MLKLTFAALFFCCAVGTHALLWNDLRTTWSPAGPTAGFNRQPKTVHEAQKAGWSKLPGSTCQKNGEFNGIRYRKGTDNSIVLIYDIKGTIAGIQMSIPEAEMQKSKNQDFRIKDIPYFHKLTQDGKAYWVATAYFVNPAIICKAGRTSAQVIATGVWVQNGPKPNNLVQVPLTRQNALKSGWSNSGCVPGMGLHSFYHLANYQKTACNVIDPIFGLYNEKGDLHGFGFQIFGKVVNRNFENTATQGAMAVVGAVAPPCLKSTLDKDGITQMHVYFIDRPWEWKCPASG